MEQKPFCYWMTGLSGAGKSSLARQVEQDLSRLGYRVHVLDGDSLRAGLNVDLGFSRGDRRENIRRIGEVARLMVDAGLIVLVSAISPYREDRTAALQRIGRRDCLEVFVDADLATCRARDAKGLYARAAAGTLSNLTGVGDPYEAPEHPGIHIDTTRCSVEQGAAAVVGHYLALRRATRAR